MTKVNFSGYKIKDVIEAEKQHKFTVISTFAGGGGSSIGYKLAGGKVATVNEIDPLACEVYKSNFPNTPIVQEDIRYIDSKKILKDAGLKVGELDILDGSPPCSSFSMAGSREKGWGKKKVFAEGQTEQILDDLFFAFSLLVEEIQPKVFVAENVKGLVSGVAKGYFKNIMQDLKSKGYVVHAKLINAKYIGVPQSRERIIIIGIRNDVYWPAMEKLIFPRPLGNVVSVMDSMLGLPKEDTSLKKYLKRNSSRYILHQMSKNGDSFDIANLKLNGKKSGFTAIKVHPHKPCPTITATPNLFHWKEPRYLSIQEITRLMGLPDDYKNTGTFYQQWARVGYMVPPPMIYHIARNLYENILSFKQEIKI